MTRPSKRSGGFTLPEILIGLTVFASVATFLVQLTSQVSMTRELVTDKQELLAVASSVISRLNREIQLAYGRGRPLLSEPGTTTTDQGRNVYLRSTKATLPEGARGDTLSFVALDAGQHLPGRRSTQGAVQLTYRVAPDPESDVGNVLVREELPLIDPPEEARKQRVVFPIARGVIELRFAFFHLDQEEWRDEWGQRTDERLPGSISFLIRLRGPQGNEVEYVSTVIVGEGE